MQEPLATSNEHSHGIDAENQNAASIAAHSVTPHSVAAQDVASPVRRQLLALAALGCGSAALLAAQPARADIVDFLDHLWNLDPIVLNFAWEMEELECDFFGKAMASDGYGELEGRERGFFNTIARQDTEHFAMLGAVRAKMHAKGAGHLETPNASSTFRPRRFKIPRMRSREELLTEAIDLKEAVLFAYHGAVPYVNNKKLLGVAAAVAGVEGRHVAVLRYMKGLPPVPTSFEGAVKPQKSGNRLARYNFKGGSIRGGIS